MNLSSYFFVPGVSQGNERESSPRFPYITPGVWELSHSLFASEVAYFSMCGVFVVIRPIVVGFCSIGGAGCCYSG